MLQASAFKCLKPQHLQSQLVLLQRTYSSRSPSESEEADFEAARQWFAKFNAKSSSSSFIAKYGVDEEQSNILPAKLATTKFVRPRGAGGQKTNKTSSAADTKWSMADLEKVLPKVLYQGLRGSRYCVSKGEDIRIKCDEQRDQSKNKEITHQRLANELERIFKASVPGVTTATQHEKVATIAATSHPWNVDRRENLKNRAQLLKEKFEKCSAHKRKQLEARESRAAEARESEKSRGDKKKKKSPRK